MHQVGHWLRLSVPFEGWSSARRWERLVDPIHQ